MPPSGARFLVFLAGVFLLAGAGLSRAQTSQPVPGLNARVTDQTGTLSADQRSRLEAKLAAFEAQKGAQIAVLLVPTVQPETIEQYSIRVLDTWKLGRKGVDDGVLLLIAKQDKKLRIEVGYGLEGVLNDATAKRIISETITPRFKQGDFYGGIDAGLDAIIKVVDGEALPPPRTIADAGSAPSGISDQLETLFFVGFILVFVIGGVLRAIFGRFLGAGIIGGIAGVLASLLISSLFVAGTIGVVAFVVSLFAGRSGGGGWLPGGGRGAAARGVPAGFRAVVVALVAAAPRETGDATAQTVSSPDLATVAGSASVSATASGRNRTSNRSFRARPSGRTTLRCRSLDSAGGAATQSIGAGQSNRAVLAIAGVGYRGQQRRVDLSAAD